jgi:flagellar hook protein FlgE
MSMLQALFNSLSGMFGFSKGLDNIGNNISNMNTPGFRGRQAFFENVGDGDGTRMGDAVTDTSAGDVQQTASTTDLAIDGKGMFILRDSNGHTFYTRAGHFRFDDNGFLIDDGTGYRVAALDDAGKLTDFTIANMLTLPPVATTAVNFSGNLSTTDTSKQVAGIVVYDAAGGSHSLTLTFTDNSKVTAGSRTVSVTDEKGASVGTGEVRFATDGTLKAGFEKMTLNLSYNGASQPVVLNFGSPGTYTGTTQISGAASTVSAKVADGHGVVGVSTASFDETGQLQLTYTDTESKTGQQVALATASDEQAFQLQDAALYTVGSGTAIHLGKAGDANFGNIKGSSLELSNVDLTRELTQMIIVQRGYQASSRVLSVTDTMLQQLYQSTGGGGG